MTEDFDPYYKWLGIPPKEQPPHYYRLLGIELFEADPDVITNAAEQRTLYVQALQSGKNAVVSKKVQKKIAAAKACLLDSVKKAEYDISLRLQLRLPKAQPLITAVQLPSPPPPPRPIYQDPSPGTQPSPEQFANTDYSLNPIVIAKETYDWFRHHRKVTSVIIKLGCAALVLVIMLLVFAHGTNLWTYIFDKSSDLVAKITGSSEQKPPERLVRMRSAPGGMRGNPRNIADKPDGQNASTPESGERNSAIPPPPTEEPAVTPATTENSRPPDVISSAEPIPAETTNEISILNLPSGKVFKSRLFKVNIIPVMDVLKDPAKEDSVLLLEDPFGGISAFAEHKKGILDGVYVGFNADLQPMTYAVFADGELDGIMKTWNEQGKRVCWCQYEKGIRHGFCCYFKDNSLRLILEMEHDAVGGIHLIANGEIKKSFAKEDEIANDKEVRLLLDELNDLQSELKENETIFKKQIKDEEQRQRRDRKVVLTPQKKVALQQQLSQRAAEKQLLIKNLWQYKGMVRAQAYLLPKMPVAYQIPFEPRFMSYPNTRCEARTALQ